MGIDLHIHTLYSDGDTTPAGIVELAAGRRLKAIAITDHDTAEGVAEAQQAGLEYGLEVVCGIELSTHWLGKSGERSAHLLGYYFDAENDEMRRGLDWIQEGRHLRNEQILFKLQELGIVITQEELAETAGGGLVGRPHIAKILTAKGVVQSVDEAFALYLGWGKKAYVKRRSMPLGDAIVMLHRAGGAAVLAHPCTLDYHGAELEEELTAMAAAGLDGLEIYYPKHGRRFKKELRSIACKNAMIVTGGSDYHGAVRPGTSLAGGKNLFVADFILEELRQRAAKIKERNSKNECKEGE